MVRNHALLRLCCLAVMPKTAACNKCHCVHCTVWYTVRVMNRILEIAVTMALCGLVAGCETSGLSLIGDDETPTSVSSPGNNAGLAGDLPPINSELPADNGGLTADNIQLPANIGRYPPPQRYYELILVGFPRGTRCEVADAHGRVSRRGSGSRVIIRITGYPSVGTVSCNSDDVAEFVIDTNKWAFTQPRRPGLREGDVEKVYLEVEYSLSAAKLRPIANMTMHTSAGTFQDRFVLDNLKPPRPAQYGLPPG